jgi:Asp-tRNA(Asn)/Glu-tRNA(Gln) amidotransferase B subunit
MPPSRFIPDNPNPEPDLDDPRIADLTVSQLQQLIRQTVQEAVAEVLIEFSIAAEADARITEEAEMLDYLRTLQPASSRRTSGHSRSDD